MANIVREASVSCPPSDVFAVLADVERLPEFSDMTVAVNNGPGRPLQVGDHFDKVLFERSHEDQAEQILARLEGTVRDRSCDVIVFSN